MLTNVVMATPRSLGARLRSVRELAGLSARELDRLAGQAEGHATVIELRESTAVRTDTADRYARVLGVSLDWLVSGSGDAPTQRSVRLAVDRARAALAATGTEG